MARVKKEKVKKEKKPRPKKEKKEKTGKKGGKKILLLIPVILILLGGAAFAVVRFVLPMLGGGGEDKVPKGLESYAIEEDTVAALDTILEEGEGELIAIRGPGKNISGLGATSASESMGERYTYIYELEGYAAVVDRYLNLLLGEEGFFMVDADYLVLEDRPELTDEDGALVVARDSVQEGHVFQLAMGWSESSGNLAIRVASPEGALRHPQKEETTSGPPAASVQEQISSLEDMTPAHLTLEGSSMSEYEISPVMGFVNIDGYDCRRFNFYKKGQSGDIAGIIFYSGDMQHIYRMDVEDNSIITELKGAGY